MSSNDTIPEAPPDRPARRHQDVFTSATQPIWSREHVRPWTWDPSPRLIRCIRRYQHWQGRWGVIGRMIQKWIAMRHRFWSIVCAADVPLECRIGGGLLLPHPSGVVIHAHATLGPNCLVFQGVTIGNGGPIPGAPRIGGHVDIGAGAKVLGGIHIGDHAMIGANAVVLCDVPQGATAVGIPARILPLDEASGGERIGPPGQR